MRVCQGCGGIVGRDCFNPIECVEISQSIIAQESVKLVSAMPGIIEKKDKEIALLKSAIRRAISISDLWLPHDLVNAEHEGESQALFTMMSDFKELVK